MFLIDRDRWIEIWVTITRNKTRSLLTCFGVFWGILMLVLLLGAGTGRRKVLPPIQSSFMQTRLAYLIKDLIKEEAGICVIGMSQLSNGK